MSNNKNTISIAIIGNDEKKIEKFKKAIDTFPDIGINIQLIDNKYYADGLIIIDEDEKIIEKTIQEQIPHTIFLKKVQGYFCKPIVLFQTVNIFFNYEHKYNFCKNETIYINAINYIINKIISYRTNCVDNKEYNLIDNKINTKVANKNKFEKNKNQLDKNQLDKNQLDKNELVKNSKKFDFSMLPSDINKLIASNLDIDSRINFNKVLTKDEDKLFNKLYSEKFYQEVIFNRLKYIFHNDNNSIDYLIKLLIFVNNLRYNIIINIQKLKDTFLNKINQILSYYDNRIVTEKVMELKNLCNEFIELTKK